MFATCKQDQPAFKIALSLTESPDNWLPELVTLSCTPCCSPSPLESLTLCLEFDLAMLLISLELDSRVDVSLAAVVAVGGGTGLVLPRMGLGAFLGSIPASLRAASASAARRLSCFSIFKSMPWKVVKGHCFYRPTSKKIEEEASQTMFKWYLLPKWKEIQHSKYLCIQASTEARVQTAD